MPLPICARPPEVANSRISDLRQHRASYYESHRRPVSREAAHQHAEPDAYLPCADGWDQR